MDYVEGNLFSIAALLPIMKDSKDELYFQGLKEKKIFSSREFQQVQKYFPELNQKEQIYLTLHLLGTRLSVSTDKIFEDKSDQSIYGIQLGNPMREEYCTRIRQPFQHNKDRRAVP